MSDPRTYQRTGACFSWEAMERQDAEESQYSDEEYDQIVADWDAKVAAEEADAAALWNDEPFFDVCV
jgi:hypothetical protein